MLSAGLGRVRHVDAGAGDTGIRRRLGGIGLCWAGLYRGVGHDRCERTTQGPARVSSRTVELGYEMSNDSLWRGQMIDLAS